MIQKGKTSFILGVNASWVVKISSSFVLTISTQGSKPGRPAAARRKSVSESPVNPKQGKHDCNTLIDAMFKLNDSEPFR